MFGNILKKKNGKENEQIVSQEVKEESLLQKLVKSQNTEDYYVLDEENAIIVIHSDEPTGYIMIHERLVDGKLVQVKKWPLKGYYFGTIQRLTTIKDLNLFQVQNGVGEFNGLYDYKEAKFVVPQGIWNEIVCKIKKYNGFLAYFEIFADYEEGDVFSYINPVTNKKMVESFGARERYYYAILNLDGTVRGNKLFKGDSFSKIEEIIDLDNYESVEAFKQERKEICNQTKQRKKQHYQEMIAERNDGSISPYLDSEVMRILEMKK